MPQTDVETVSGDQLQVSMGFPICREFGVPHAQEVQQCL